MKVKFKKLTSEAKEPYRKHEVDAGFDLVATSKKKVEDGDSSFGYMEYGTGLAFEIPEGYAGFIYPRSSISNTGHILSNSVGVIDSSYRGEVRARFRTVPQSKEYQVGERMCQLVIQKLPYVTFEESNELEESNRGQSGFGSTGKK